MFVVEFIPRAARQLAEARDWWRANRDKAPNAFDEDLAELVLMLEHLPHATGSPVAQRHGVRRAVLTRIRYKVYFQVLESSVEVLAVWHASRRGSPKLDAGP